MNLEMLNTSQIWLSDGTFKTAPTLFAQVYCIHGLRGGPNLLEDGHLLPSLFVLLPNKMEASVCNPGAYFPIPGFGIDPILNPGIPGLNIPRYIVWKSWYV